MTTDAKNFDEVIEKLTDAVELLNQMRADGVEVDPDGGTADDYLHLVTTDPEIPKKYDMHVEREFWGVTSFASERLLVKLTEKTPDPIR